MARFFPATILSKRAWNPILSSILVSKARNPFQFRQFCTQNTTKLEPKLIRNAIVMSHIDHGKSSICDRILSTCGIKTETERVMDSNTFEKERGITIFAKNTTMNYKGHQINIVDSPGHADFGAEVERVLSMVEGAILLVDATEGPMPQTKFVLRKALAKGIKVIVVLNKMDRDTIRVNEVETEIFDLFTALEASDEQFHYPTFYASAREGWIKTSIKGEKIQNMGPLLDAIIEYIPPPKVDPDGPFKLLVTNIEMDPHFGKILTGRIESGGVKIGDTVNLLDMHSAPKSQGNTVMKITGKRGIKGVDLSEGVCGDIIGLAGVGDGRVTDTVCSPTVSTALPTDPIDPPIISMAVSVNSSPLQGRDGTELTGNKIKQRLERELQTNVAMQMEPTGDAFKLSGRGELHLGILLESMRREGYELSVAPPEVVMRKDEEGNLLEPMEEVTVDVEKQFGSLIMEKMSQRRGLLIDTMERDALRIQYKFVCLARAMFGLRSELTMLTKGTSNLYHTFHSWVPYSGPLPKTEKGALVSMSSGTATAYSLLGIEPRGILYISPGEDVYEGMIIGEHNKPGDLNVNPVKAKHLTNIRAAGKEDFVKLSTPRTLTLEDAISIVKDDEMVELTPNHIRLRKEILNSEMRIKLARQEKKERR